MGFGFHPGGGVRPGLLVAFVALDVVVADAVVDGGGRGGCGARVEHAVGDGAVFVDGVP